VTSGEQLLAILLAQLVGESCCRCALQHAGSVLVIFTAVQAAAEQTVQHDRKQLLAVAQFMKQLTLATTAAAAAAAGAVDSSSSDCTV
jgi:predicted YcjX-like family ATPase